MQRHKKRVKRLRGHRTHGRGLAKHGRGSGSWKGRGSVKRGRSRLYIMKYEPERMPTYKDNIGFWSVKQLRMDQKGINLRDLVKLSQEKEIDVTKFGYTKVIGGGDLAKPLIVKALFFSESAKQKIEKAGGKAVLLNAEGE